MSDTSSRASAPSILPEAVRLFIWRKSLELTGLAVISVTLIAAVGLASWSIADPSLNHAADRIPQNLLGYPGAVFADLVMQLFGLGALALLLPPLVWGCLLVSRGMIERFRWRLVFWLLGICATAGAFSTVFVPETWPLPTGLGGVVGDAIGMVAIVPFKLLLTSLSLAKIVAGMLMFIIATVIMARACAVTSRDVHRTGEYLNTEGTEMAARGLGLFARLMRYIVVLIAGLIARKKTSQADDDWIAGHHEPAPESAKRGRWSLSSLWQLWRNAGFAEPGTGPLRDSGGRIEPTFGAEDTPSDIEPPWFGDDPEPDEAPAARPAARRSSRPRPPASGPVTDYRLPPLSLLAAPKSKSGGIGLAREDLEQNARLLETVLDDFGIRGEIINVRPGPVITLYELEPAPGIKSSRVIGLADDIARSMSAISARVAVVPGRNAIGIELPNPNREMVYLRQLLEGGPFEDPSFGLPLGLGKDIGGGPIIGDLARMPHLLIAGTTGSGKSVGINTMILSLLYKLPPDKCRFIMIDPKMLELSVYDGIPHLLAPVVTDPKKAVVALKWTVREMEDRYQKMSKLGVRNMDGYNERALEAAAKGETISRTVQTGFDSETGKPIYETEEIVPEPMPFIVVIVDEMADLMMVAGKEIEGTVQRLAQMARAAGIHLITATQRPSVDVITGTIKANFPTRISFQVTSKIDSRTILGEQGAEQLLGRGDMLLMAGGGRISRVHGPFVSDGEVEKVVKFLKKQGAPEYVEAVTIEPEEGGWDGMAGGGESEGDDLYRQAVEIVMRDRKASTSYIQRRLSIGYNRAATIIERMEQEGIIGAANHAGKREILLGEAG